jgi:hypothetical protein
MTSTGRLMLGAEWTDEEMRSLLVLLERCSKNNPDEIAQRLKTKSSVQVAAMIAHLHKKYLTHEAYIMQNQRLPAQATRTKTQELKQEVLQARAKSRRLDQLNILKNDNLKLTPWQLTCLELLDVFKMQQFAGEIYKREECSMQPVLLTLTSLELCQVVRSFTKTLIEKAIVFRKQKLVISASDKKSTLVIVESDVLQAAQMG